MRRHLITFTGIAGAVLAAGLVAGPALAAGGGPGPQAGNGNGAGPRPGSGQGTLTAEQKADLAAMAEEEKLAHDVYVWLYSVNHDRRFSRISEAETRHQTAIRTLLARYGVADSTAGKGAGDFTTPAIQRLYNELVARGDDSLSAALSVGRDIERMDIADLVTAADGVTAPDVLNVYANLSSGSQNHLRAFEG